MGGPIMEEGEQGSIVTFADFLNDKSREAKTAAGPPTPLRTTSTKVLLVGPSLVDCPSDTVAGF